MWQDNFILFIFFHNCFLVACSNNQNTLYIVLAPARCWIYNQKLKMSEAIMHHNIVMHIQFLRKLIINKREETTNFNIFISTKQHLAHQKKEVKSTIDVLTFSIHYKSKGFSFPDTSENQYDFDIALCMFCTDRLFYDPFFSVMEKTGLFLILLCAVLLSCLTQSQYWTQSVWYLVQSQWYLNQTNSDIWPNQADI